MMTDHSSSKIAILIPCHNEQGRIAKVVESVRRVLPAASVIVVNDGSDDDTGKEALSAGAVVLTHSSNIGYGAALETGYMYAVRHGFQFLLQMDGDGQHLAEELPKLLSPLERDETDIVIGSRYGEKNNNIRPGFMRRLGHSVFAFLLFLVSGRFFQDPTSGFQGLNRHALDLLASGVLPYDYPDSDVLLMALMAGLRVMDVPVLMLPRPSGKSMHSGIAPVYYGMKMALSMFIVLINFRVWHKWKDTHDRSHTNAERRR